MGGLKQWVLRDADAVLVKKLKEALGIHPAVAGVLVCRGVHAPEDAEKFLNPRLSSLSDPFEMSGMKEAVDRLWRAIDESEDISVFGDYDADGVTAAALAVSVLVRLGAKVKPFLPNRFLDGYGLTQGALARCIEDQKPGLILTVDCGTTSVDSVKEAAESSVDVIITDHHEISGEPAKAVALVNPRMSGNPDISDLAGVGVVFKLCHGLIKQGLNDGRDIVKKIDLRDWLDFVAIGTVTDVVPLMRENRILVSHGLARLNRTVSIGLKALMEVARVKGTVTGYHIGFVLGPRLNAAGRLGGAETALELLLTSDRARAVDLAKKLDSDNRERRRIEDSILKEALDSLNTKFSPDSDYGVAIGGKGWHTGTLGIVASRICGRIHRPVILVGFDENGDGKGSGRSVDGLDLVDVLKVCSNHLEGFGGHKMAAGITIREEKFEEFARAFREECNRRLLNKGVNVIREVDGVISLRDIDNEFFQSVRSLAPFGTGNPEPLWMTRGVGLVGNPRKVGGNGEHLKMRVEEGGVEIGAFAPGLGNREIPDGSFDILFRVREDTYAGRSAIELNIRDIRENG